MDRTIKLLQNNRKVIFDQGKFDNWCVYIVESSGNKKAPFDTEYFRDLQKIATHYEDNKVYNDFVLIYEQTNNIIDTHVLSSIDKITKTYNPEHQILIEQWFTVIYAGMIAEENKQYAVLKKRIKRLGMYQVLVEKMQPEEAANFSKGKKAKDLDPIMKEYGF